MPSRIDDLREHIAALARALESELVLASDRTC